MVCIQALSTLVNPVVFLIKFYFYTLTSSPAVLNSLQFAAHIHGNLIIMSLSAMLLHFIHRGLSSRHGVPVGFIASGFQLNSLTYIFSEEFRVLNLRYVGVFLGAFALVMLTGPSSAIAMIPRLQFWPIDNVWIGPGAIDIRVFIQANQTTLYPDTLTAANVSPQCLQANASLLSECPAYGMRRWLMADEELFNIDDHNGAWRNINKSIEDGGWVRYVVGASSPASVTMQTSYVASSLSNFLGKALMSYSNLLEILTPSTLGIGGSGIHGSLQSRGKTLARYDLSFLSDRTQVGTQKPLVSRCLVDLSS
jgi:hypothetical protein